MRESIDYTLVDLEREDGADWCCEKYSGSEFGVQEGFTKRISNAQLGWESAHWRNGRIGGRKHKTSYKRPEGKNAESICLLLKTAGVDWSEPLEPIHVLAAVKIVVSSVPECSIPISSLNHHLLQSSSSPTSPPSSSHHQ